ncbi:hypothetical protein C361_04481 [Cryptococcus neoformans Tu259-1]|uniref:Peptidase S9 prolyl oligopeptidase catalytic domain-containing protein n=1 Tax=Cryptococcus neoformans Tu259-1 TaxID=1230072 RepID=A0A854QHW3_CRYNE|nr:hypothetical protein C361_04481 [Cryptococcus neoformans var. grubii Tu259-1]
MLKPSVQLLLIVVQAFPARKEGGEGRLTAASKMNAFTDLIYHAYGYTSTPTSFSLACSKRDIKRERVSRSLGIFVNCPNLGSGDSDFSCHCTKLWVAAADVDSEAVFEKRMFKREKHLNAFSIAPSIASGKFTLPPTYIIRGIIDDKVPIKQSEDVFKAYKQQNIDATFEVLEGVDHLFDMDPRYTLDEMYAFITKLVQ